MNDAVATMAGAASTARRVVRARDQRNHKIGAEHHMDDEVMTQARADELKADIVQKYSNEVVDACVKGGWTNSPLDTWLEPGRVLLCC